MHWMSEYQINVNVLSENTPPPLPANTTNYQQTIRFQLSESSVIVQVTLIPNQTMIESQLRTPFLLMQLTGIGICLLLSVISYYAAYNYLMSRSISGLTRQLTLETQLREQAEYQLEQNRCESDGASAAP
jgi:hypothetical protein